MAAPVFEGAARRWLIRNFIIGVGSAVALGEAYRRFYVIPEREKRIRFYRENYGIDYEKLL